MLEDIRQKIEQLIARYEAEKETRKLTEAFTGGGDRAAAKEKVDTLIREIGKCISCLED